MQLGDFLSYALLTIAVTAACVLGEEYNQKPESEERRSKRLQKRNTAIFVDNFRIESLNSQNPKVIYRKVSRQRYSPPKPIYGPPKPKYSPPPKARKPSKKYRKPMTSKYGIPPKPRSPKPRYGPPKWANKPAYGPPKRPLTTIPQYYNPEPAGFAEPPIDYEHQPQKQSYAEPPVDSYGIPLKATNEPYPNAPSYIENNQFAHDEYSNMGPEYQPWQYYQRDSNRDNTHASSKNRPLFMKPDELFDFKANEDEDFHVNFYSELNNYNFQEPQYLDNRKKRPRFFADSNKNKNRHWKMPKLSPENSDSEGEILVGGQYAEPPARYVPKFQPSAPMYAGDHDFSPLQSFVDAETAASSATMSPYVNYKNSNMAFSPQNLNDAFSIVEK